MDICTRCTALLALRSLPEQYKDCLCPHCLQEFIKVESVSVDSNKLLEGQDYYLEKGLTVFTEKYHLDRGSCCKSGCRHCPYS